PFPCGHVARDFQETVKVPGKITPGGDDHVGPEASSVLSQTPAFIFEAALLDRYLQFMFRPAFLNGFFGIELREVLANDFVGPVPFDALRTGIPAHHLSPAVQHDDGIILNLANHLAKLRLLLQYSEAGLHTLDYTNKRWCQSKED